MDEKKNSTICEEQIIKLNYLMMPTVNFDKVIIPESCEKLITSWRIGCDISNKLEKLLGTTKCLIIDATANIGGLTIPLSKKFQYVAAYEIEKSYCEILEKNINLYNINNVTIINEDFTSIIKFCTKPKAIIIDPPWYNTDGSFNQNMKLSGVNISLLIKYLFLITDSIILIKVPINYLNSELNYSFTYNYKKMKFLVFMKYHYLRCN